jgi:3-hydroxyisobutyrate dehydrogenase
MRFGWIGLGDIGAPMAMRIHQAGLPLTVWNRTTSRMQPFADAGAATAGSAAEVAAASDVVLLCIDSPDGLDAVLFGPAGVADASAPPRLVVDTSTMHPQVSIDIAARLAGSGIAFVDAPVSGGPQGAAAGTLSVFAGGAEEHVALARPALEAFAGRITHLGPLGSGQVGKACNQVINFTTMAAIAEATSLGEAFGLDVDLLVRAITGGLADSAMLREYIRATDAGESSGITAIVNGLRSLYVESSAHPTGGRVDILLKDLGAALDVARRNNSAAPVSGVLEGVYRMLLHRQAGP